MASGDTDHIEVMDSTVSKKSENATGTSISEDDGSAILNLIKTLTYPSVTFSATFVSFLTSVTVVNSESVTTTYVVYLFSDRDRVSIAEKNVPYDVSTRSITLSYTNISCKSAVWA